MCIKVMLWTRCDQLTCTALNSPVRGLKMIDNKIYVITDEPTHEPQPITISTLSTNNIQLLDLSTDGPMIIQIRHATYNVKVSDCKLTIKSWRPKVYWTDIVEPFMLSDMFKTCWVEGASIELKTEDMTMLEVLAQFSDVTDSGERPAGLMKIHLKTGIGVYCRVEDRHLIIERFKVTSGLGSSSSFRKMVTDTNQRSLKTGYIIHVHVHA